MALSDLIVPIILIALLVGAIYLGGRVFGAGFRKSQGDDR